MPEGIYVATAKCDLRLPDSPAYWMADKNYDCKIYNDGSVCIAPHQGGNITFTADKVDQLKEVFEFMAVA